MTPGAGRGHGQALPSSLPGTQPCGHLALRLLRADPGGSGFLLLGAPWSVRLFPLPQDPPPFGDPWKGCWGHERGGGGRTWGRDPAVGLVLAFAENKIIDQTLPLLSLGFPPKRVWGSCFLLLECTPKPPHLHPLDGHPALPSSMTSPRAADQLPCPQSLAHTPTTRLPAGPWRGAVEPTTITCSPASPRCPSRTRLAPALSWPS